MSGMLDGLRVADLTIVTAGAAATQVLADFGADVIKIEGVTRPDLYRGGMGGDIGADVAFPPFRTANRNKRAIAVDLKTPEGLEVVRRIVATSDVVAENFRRGVVERLGLGFRDLVAIRPDIVLASISSQGLTGPSSGFTSFGLTLDALGGVMSYSGYDSDSPIWSSARINYPDQTANSLGPALIIAAVLASRRDGQARWLDLSQRETVTALMGDQVLRTSLTGENPVPTGNSTPDSIEWLTPSSGDDAWVAISLRSPEELELVASVVGADLSGAGDDAARAALVRATTERWSASRSDADASATLRAAGVMAMPVRSGEQLLDDPYLRSRGWWQEVSAPGGGTERQRGWAVAFDEGGPDHIRRNGPRIGEDTFEVLGELGYDEDEIASLVEQSVVSAPANARQG
ncbi:CaiB/BaiF CoA transferase family protein [Streptomyces sp. HD]|uniref:CaiB/BaiF CoA transferase family protein n=1 Tax=Streptomyces sp. HD TaxID=3020892 RepID=UPI00232B29C2|nr:CoA transferase [Streptomyces sp. HD]MDC0770790.1 CoA transferase [Streptomyces sp. HD]